MSKVRADNFTNRAADGAPTFTKGVSVTGVITATSGSFSGNVSVVGTLTYEDVTNIDRESLLKLIKKYLKNRSLLADWDIIQQTPTEQLVNYSGVLVPFTPEEKQLLLEAKTIMGRSRALEALYQSYTVEETADTSTQLH